jgi:hypothetical protein
LVSGAVAGAAGGIIAAVPLPLRLGLWVPAVAVIVALELAGRPLALPQNRRVVPQTIVPRTQFDGPFQFGFEMGTGVRTFMPTALPHALLLTVALLGGIGPGLLAGLGFGLGRALMLALRLPSRDPQRWEARLLGSLAGLGRGCAIAFALWASILVAAELAP